MLIDIVVAMLTGLTHQRTVTIHEAGGSIAREVQREVVVVVIGVLRAPRQRAEVGSLGIEAVAIQCRRHREWAAAACVVRRAPLCI